MNDNNCNNRITAKSIYNANLSAHNDKKNKILAIVFTLVYLGVYFFAWYFFEFLGDVGERLSSGNNIAEYTLRDFVGSCNVCMLFAMIPCIYATVYSFEAKKRFLISFNLIFLIIHIVFFFIEGKL